MPATDAQTPTCRPVPPDATAAEEAALVAQTAQALLADAADDDRPAVVAAPAPDVHVAAMGHRMGRFA